MLYDTNDAAHVPFHTNPVPLNTKPVLYNTNHAALALFHTKPVLFSDMQDLQARIREKDERMAELLTLREELENERRRAEELRMEMERSHEMEQSERQRLVSHSVLFCLCCFALRSLIGSVKLLGHM